MTKSARLTKAELRRALEVAEEKGKQLRVDPDGSLVFEERDADDLHKPRRHVAPVREAVL